MKENWGKMERFSPFCRGLAKFAIVDQIYRALAKKAEYLAEATEHFWQPHIVLILWQKIQSALAKIPEFMNAILLSNRNLLIFLHFEFQSPLFSRNICKFYKPLSPCIFIPNLS